jgi:tungstate transport system substrate-binding protein
VARGLALVAGIVALGLVAPASSAEDASESAVLVATTTSVQDAGLLEAILPEFERASGIRTRVVAVGSGAALAMGARGDADLVLSHAPEAEQRLLAEGAFVSRRPFLENFFVIAGPPEDPARVREAASAPEALRRIAEGRAAYVSRGDASGTHRREQALLEAAGLDRRGGWEGFSSTGAGMGLTLQVAGEKRAYTLSDLGTFLAFRERSGLAALSKQEPSLRNEYSILRPNPARAPAGRPLATGAADRLEAFLLDPATRARIAAFGIHRFGTALFTPIASQGSGEAGPGS